MHHDDDTEIDDWKINPQTPEEWERWREANDRALTEWKEEIRKKLPVIEELSTHDDDYWDEAPPQGKKFDTTKVPVHLIPPDALFEVARVLAFGAKKYDAWNWYEGINYSRLFRAAITHLWKFWRRKDKDPESGLSHVAHAACCALFLLQFITEGRHALDDRPVWKPNTRIEEELDEEIST